MMNDAFSTQVLSEKLAKLNNSQQSIETLSNWCIFHRKKARQVVETWEKLFNNSPKEQRVPFLYLANDILQNSRRKGSEFVNEYWKVLPGALKSVFENDDEHGKNVVTRLVDIWDQRKVFGSRSKGLKDDMLGKEAPPVESNGKSSNFIKIVRKDAQSIRIKLAVGGMPEKIVTAFQSVNDEHLNEDATLIKFQSAVQQVGKVEKEVEKACNQGGLERSPLANVLQEQEDFMKQGIEQLESVEAARQSLISRLKEALQEQESKLELVHTQLKVAQAEKERVVIMKQRLTSGPAVIPSQGSKSVADSNVSTAPTVTATETATVLEASMPVRPSQLQPSLPVTSFGSYLTEELHKKAAAEVAAKLTASTSSAQMLTSVLSSLVAEEVASMNGVKHGNFATSAPNFPPEKRPKLEKPMSLSDISSTFFGQVPQQLTTSIPLTLPQASAASIQPISQSYLPQPPLPPPPPPVPPPPQVQQYAQSSSTMVSVMPYLYGSNPLPLPPLPSNVPISIPRPSSQPPLQPKQQQEQPLATGFYQSPGIGFYGQPSTTPVPRQ